MSDDPAIALVTDSTASLTAEDRERLQIEIVNLYVIMNGDQRPENEITDYTEFYKAVLDSPQLTTTSQPSIGDFMEVYEPLLEAGKEIVSLHISSGISGTVEAARQAAEHRVEGRGGERITVVDSRTTAGGLALTALASANAINAGKSVAETVEQTLAAREAVQTWIMIDTLEYLHKGGRIGSAEAGSVAR
ncbi:MAG: DegV family protein [Solirubrobacterales bacterium]|nr:DegV family protein [Solirubrobacterales bacterium]